MSGLLASIYDALLFIFSPPDAAEQINEEIADICEVFSTTLDDVTERMLVNNITVNLYENPWLGFLVDTECWQRLSGDVSEISLFGQRGAPEWFSNGYWGLLLRKHVFSQARCVDHVRRHLDPATGERISGFDDLIVDPSVTLVCVSPQDFKSRIERGARPGTIVFNPPLNKMRDAYAQVFATILIADSVMPWIDYRKLRTLYIRTARQNGFQTNVRQ